MMKAADHILDLGPGAGENGGHLVYSGTLDGLKNCIGSLTGKYLIGELKVPIPKKRRTPGPKCSS
jgi:excinuclease ABC subunit A